MSVGKRNDNCNVIAKRIVQWSCICAWAGCIVIMIWLLSIYTDQTYTPKLMKIQTLMATATGNSTDANMLVWESEISPIAEWALSV